MFEGVFTRNFWIATALSIVVIFSWDYFVMDDISEELKNSEQAVQTQEKQIVDAEIPSTIQPKTREEILTVPGNGRITFENSNFDGSISLEGGRVDDVKLKHYQETLEEDSGEVIVFDLKGTNNAYFFESGWLAESITTPKSETVWRANATHLTPETPVTLIWRTREATYQKTYSIDNEYVITVEDSVINNTSGAISVSPYAFIQRHGDPDVQDLFISHEGFVGYMGDILERADYEDVAGGGNISYSGNNGGYLAFTDKYFLASLILDENSSYISRFSSFQDAYRQNNYQIDYVASKVILNAGESLSNTTHVFVGPKEYNILASYKDKFNIPNFEDTIDFGWFFFFTKPMIKFLLWIYSLVGEFGIAILIFTVIIRLIILPIAYKSYLSMAKMRELQPKMKELKEKHSSDMQRYNKELMALYKKEQVNPLSGCLPVLLQIPIFFSIYKVIFISIELRHAPFWGWISDMSVKDPTNLFTLFGLIPIDLPAFLHIGIWPIFMGITMFIQQKLSSGTAAMDPMQRKVMNLMPFVLTIVLANFPVGLVIYWTWSNIISIIQQYIINKRVKKQMELKKAKYVS